MTRGGPGPARRRGRRDRLARARNRRGSGPEGARRRTGGRRPVGLGPGRRLLLRRRRRRLLLDDPLGRGDAAARGDRHLGLGRSGRLVGRNARVRGRSRSRGCRRDRGCCRGGGRLGSRGRGRGGRRLGGCRLGGLPGRLVRDRRGTSLGGDRLDCRPVRRSGLDSGGCRSFGRRRAGRRAGGRRGRPRRLGHRGRLRRHRGRHRLRRGLQQAVALGSAPDPVGLGLDDAGGVRLDSDAERDTEIQRLLVAESELFGQLVDADLAWQTNAPFRTGRRGRSAQGRPPGALATIPEA